MEHSPIDYSYFINPFSARREVPIPERIARMESNSPREVISLAVGNPDEAVFPFEKIDFMLKDGSNFSLKGQDIRDAFQYSPTQGYPGLVKLLKEFTQRLHQPPCWENRELTVTIGAQDGISKSIEMCLQEGDPIIIHNPLYSGTLRVLRPFQPTVITIDQDQHGMVPQMLRKKLEEWKKKCSDERDKYKMPKLMFINPTGLNPTGTTMPLDRRFEIYQICCQYNILIIEDDPHEFINFSGPPPSSFLSLDTEGRVLRLDSFSKVLGPGLRIGWLTGPKPLVEAIQLHIQSSYGQSSSFTQVIMQNIMQVWGFEKLIQHFTSARDIYKMRRDLTLASMERHLKGLADWTKPEGGIVVWIKVLGVVDVSEIVERATKRGFMFMPGSMYMADPSEPSNYVRASFGRATPRQIDKAMSVLAEVIREERMTSRKKLKKCNQ